MKVDLYSLHNICTWGYNHTFYRYILQSSTFFDVLLTVHLSIILAINQLNAQNLIL